MDFLLGCHDPLLTGTFFTTGETRGPCSVAGRCNGGSMTDRGEGCEGDGDRDRLKLDIACCASDGDDGLLNFLNPFCPGTGSGWMMPKPDTGLTGPSPFGYFGLCPAVVSSLVFVMTAALFLFPLIVVALARGGGRFV